MVYFTADLHFWHKNVIDFCGRPWKSVEEMNEGLIENWNSVVTNDDDVYILGDMFFCGTTKLVPIMKRLNGKKHLVRGNHDWSVIKPRRAAEFGFASVFEYGSYIDPVTKHHFVLSHFPYRGRGDYTEKERFDQMRLPDCGHFLLHGHVHILWKYKSNMINVGCDVWDYKPVSIEQIIAGIDFATTPGYGRY